MAKFIRSFRAKIIVLFGLSMLLGGIITYLFFKGLQLYYHATVRRGDPLAELRQFIGSIGDFNFFFILFISLSFVFFFVNSNRFKVGFNDL